MFRLTTLILALAMLPLATAADAQGRHNRNRLDRREVARAQGVPPGQLPPANMCRVWYEGQPPGRQPRPTSCREAESVASRTRNARVVYGENVYADRSGYYGNDTRTYPYPDNDRGVNRIPGRDRVPGGIYGQRYPNDRRYPNDQRYPNSGRYGYGDTAYENGYRDGREQGLEDGRDNDRFDATRHGRYRSADRGYIDSYGDKTRYKNNYRDGFQAGYSDGFREGNYRR
jgi:hypothetical protein